MREYDHDNHTNHYQQAILLFQIVLKVYSKLVVIQFVASVAFESWKLLSI